MDPRDLPGTAIKGLARPVCVSVSAGRSHWTWGITYAAAASTPSVGLVDPGAPARTPSEGGEVTGNGAAGADPAITGKAGGVDGGRSLGMGCCVPTGLVALAAAHYGAMECFRRAMLPDMPDNAALRWYGKAVALSRMNTEMVRVLKECQAATPGRATATGGRANGSAGGAGGVPVSGRG